MVKAAKLNLSLLAYLPPEKIIKHRHDTGIWLISKIWSKQWEPFVGDVTRLKV